MKKVFTIILTLLNLFLFSQKKMEEKLNLLFLNLDLNSTPEIMTKNSTLNFEYGVNRGVEWSGGNTKIFTAKFNRNLLIESKIKEGQIFIRQTEKDAKLGIYEINERIEFENAEDMLHEFYKISSSYEEYGYKIKNLTRESENYETISEYNQIYIQSDTFLSSLTIGYSLPRQEEEKKFYLIITFKNKID